MRVERSLLRVGWEMVRFYIPLAEWYVALRTDPFEIRAIVWMPSKNQMEYSCNDGLDERAESMAGSSRFFVVGSFRRTHMRTPNR